MFCASAAERRADEEDRRSRSASAAGGRGRRRAGRTPARSRVEVSMYAVKTHEYCVIPPRSETIVGSAVATIVWSSAASSSVTISPT